ncbi:S-adenosyl-L-methionine-dependent methyltransferase [Podospora australis]|uniref:S-adenosyl-L-methionine-dependent methyltransferase n=1 Tax=Podospora australis TaxID=1536484 RepID=A0AAN6WTH5_9PEZI|nr:S-adenosyl-L-methionine-dependent methyltransferase [Podospora australis]
MANTNSSDTFPPFVPTKLIKHFDATGKTHEEQGSGWVALWETEQNDLWDRGKPSPALMDFLESASASEILPAAKHGRPLKVLVPGCGKGYDVAMLALHGFNVYGLDISETGVETARKYAAAELSSPAEHNFSSPDFPRDKRGAVTFIAGNFFSRDWETKCCADVEDAFEGFDVIYDYTFLCALLPSMRKDWARRMGELVAPHGVLICLEFPLYKGLDLPGPPWPLREGIYLDLLAHGGDGVFETEEQAQQAIGAKNLEGRFVRIDRITPARSYEVAKGTDRLSIWRPRTAG